QRPLLSVALQPSDDVRPIRIEGKDLRRDAVLVEHAFDVLGRRALLLRRVEADERLVVPQCLGLDRGPVREPRRALRAKHAGERPENQQQISRFDAFSDRSRFIVAYPEGIDKSWADGRGTTAADRQGVDDVGFAKAVVMDIARMHAIDRMRIYATGPSNGGIF